MYDDARIKHDKAMLYNRPREKGIFPQLDRKWTTDKNLESATRGVARVGQRENAILLSHYLLQLKRLRLPPPAKNQTTIV